MAADGRHRVLVGTHASEIHLLEVQLQWQEERARAVPSVHLVASLTLAEKPSWIVRHPRLPDIFYVNSWTHNKLYMVRVSSESAQQQASSMTVVDVIDTLGAGPTHFIVNHDCSALVIATYTGGTVERHSLDLGSGLFARRGPHQAAQRSVHQLPVLKKQRPDTPRIRQRQGEPHPHQVIPFAGRIDQYLVPDLGNDCVWYLQWRDVSWECMGRLDIEPGTGPRHGLASSDGAHLYLLNELACTITVHRLVGDSRGREGTILSPAIQTISTLPQCLQSSLTGAGGFEYIACTVLLSSIAGQDSLLVSNRNAQPAVAPDGDTLASFAICTKPSHAGISGPSKSMTPHLQSPIFTAGYGRHLRGFALNQAASMTIPPRDLAIVMGREEGEISIISIDSDGMVEKLTSVKLSSIIKPVFGLWLD